jgi:TPR repeat protein
MAGNLTRAQDPSQAAPWFRHAAEQGHARAALALALLLKNGSGMPADKAESARWLEVAAKAGNGHAMFLLANALADGDGVPLGSPARARTAGTCRLSLEHPAAMHQLALIMPAAERRLTDRWTTRRPRSG